MQNLPTVKEANLTAEKLNTVLKWAAQFGSDTIKKLASELSNTDLKLTHDVIGGASKVKYAIGNEQDAICENLHVDELSNDQIEKIIENITPTFLNDPDTYNVIRTLLEDLAPENL